MKTYTLILKGIDKVDFPNHMSRSAVLLIKKLCRDVPTERLGYQRGGIDDIKKHKYVIDFYYCAFRTRFFFFGWCHFQPNLFLFEQMVPEL